MRSVSRVIAEAENQTLQDNDPMRMMPLSGAGRKWEFLYRRHTERSARFMTKGTLFNHDPDCIVLTWPQSALDS